MRTASVIIRTKNEERDLGRTLDRVMSQRVPAREVLVIDSGSTDATLEIAGRAGARILTIPSKEWGYARALNRAAAAARGEILVCLSAHCVPTSADWLGNLLRHFDDPRVAGVWGPNVSPGHPIPAPGPPVRQEAADCRAATRSWGMSNANSAVRRSLWEQFPFDESMPATEDKAWARTAMELGYCIVHDPAAAVWHAQHTFLSAYRRNRAVMAGYTVMFPELRPRVGAPMVIAARAAMRTLRVQFAGRTARRPPL